MAPKLRPSSFYRSIGSYQNRDIAVALEIFDSCSDLRDAFLGRCIYLWGFVLYSGTIMYEQHISRHLEGVLSYMYSTEGWW